MMQYDFPVITHIDQVLAAITKLVNTSAARLTASSILKSSASTAEKIAALLKL